MRAQIVPAEHAHIAVIAGDARQADIDELWAQGRHTPAECMTTGLQCSTVVHTALLDGVPVAMFGVIPHAPRQGVPWLVGSNALNQLRTQKELLRISRPMVADFQTLFPDLLFNEVDDRNTAAKRWLKWLGFSFGRPINQGPDAIAFRPFWKGQAHAQ